MSPSINRFSLLEPLLVYRCPSISQLDLYYPDIHWFDRSLRLSRLPLWVEKEKEKNNKSSNSSSGTNSETVYRSQLLPIHRFSFFGCLADDTIRFSLSGFAFFDDHYDRPTMTTHRGRRWNLQIGEWWWRRRWCCLWPWRETSDGLDGKLWISMMVGSVDAVVVGPSTNRNENEREVILTINYSINKCSSGEKMTVISSLDD